MTLQKGRSELGITELLNPFNIFSISDYSTVAMTSNSSSTSVPQRTPKSNPLPSVSTPQPVPFPTPPGRIFWTMVPNPASVHNKDENKEKKIHEMSVEKIGANAVHHHEALKKAVNLMTSSFKNQSEELKRCSKVESELRAQNETLNVQLKKLNENISCISDKKNEEEVKSEKIIWRNNCLKLNEQLRAAKDESEEKDKNIRDLIQTIQENETKIKEQETKVLSLELSERKLKKQFEDEEKKVKDGKMKIKEQERISQRKLNEQLEDKKREVQESKNKCKKIVKLEENLKKINMTNKKLESKIADFKKTDKANNTVIKKLKTERNSLKLNVKKEQEINLNITKECDMTYEELENEKNDKKVKELELEKKNKQICDLKNKVKVLEKEIDDLPQTFDANMSRLRDSFLENLTQKRRKREVSSLSSSSEKKVSPKLSSVAIYEGNENVEQPTDKQADQPETSDVTQTANGRKRKHPIGKRTTKNDGSMHPLSFKQISLDLKSQTEENAATPEVKSTSSESSSSCGTGIKQAAKKVTAISKKL